MVAYNIYNSNEASPEESRKPKFLAASTSPFSAPPRPTVPLDERLERIGYVPYEKRVARMEKETAKVLSGKTSGLDKRRAASSVERDAKESKESYDIAMSVENGLFTAAMLVYHPLFFTEDTLLSDKLDFQSIFFSNLFGIAPDHIS